MLLLQALERLLCFATVLAESLHRRNSVLQVGANTADKQVISLDLLREQRVEWFVALDRDLLFVLFGLDGLRNLQEKLVELVAEELVDLRVSLICLHLGQSWLFGSLDDKLVDVGAIHDRCCYVGCCLYRRIVM